MNTNPLADVMAKLDEARALTAILQADYRKDYAARLREYQRKAWANYKLKHPTQARAIHAKSSSRRSRQTPRSRETTAFIAFLMAEQVSCPHCFRPLSETGKSLDHIKPLVKGGTHTPDNLILLCKSCNSSKGAKLSWPPPYRFLGKTHKQLSCFD